MSADLEREELAEVAREVACEKVGQCFTQGTDVMLIARAVKAAKYAYLAAATLREKEIEELRAEVNDWRESAKKAAGEPCGDEAHCACVPLLRAEIATLRARVEELEKIASLADSIAHEFEVAVESRNPTGGMSVPPSGDFISCAQLPSAVGCMRWWAREIRKAQPIPVPETKS